MAVVNLDRPTTAAALASLRNVVLAAISRAPVNILNFAAFADRVLSITPLALVVEVVPDLEETAFPAKPATSCRIFFPEVPSHRLI